MKNKKSKTKYRNSSNNIVNNYEKDTNISLVDNNTYSKKKIPKKVKEEVWVSNFGKKYKSKCYITWCSNEVNVFNFHVGHDIPESKGGSSEDINNLKPICDRCNLSMGNQNTIQEWNKKYIKKNKYKIHYKIISIIIVFMFYYNKFILIDYFNNNVKSYKLLF